MPEPGWTDWRELLKQRKHKKWDRFSWLTLRALLSSWNHVLGSGAPRLVNDLRGRWIAGQRDAEGGWSDDFVIQRQDDRSFLVLGDPGEQDASQYVVVPPVLAQSDAGFMVILSDVIYPSGDANDYVDALYVPYQDYPGPIFGVPGNHDWYDGLNGFMWNFCGVEALAPTDYAGVGYSARERLARRLWRKASAPERDTLNAWRERRTPEGERWKPHQPGPYWAIETPDLLLVAIDTGIKGDSIDREQGDWLVRVSRASDKPKVLLTGKPLIVDFELRKCTIAAPGKCPPPPYASVQDVVLAPELRYVAVIGGDIHNYQYYEVRSPGKGRLDYFVTGGAGAYMSATHPIPRCEPPEPASDCEPLEGLEVRDFTCYPPRDKSLVHYAELFVPRIWRILLGLLLLVAGFATGVAGVFPLDLDDDLLETILAAGSIVLAVTLFALSAGLGATDRSEPSPGWLFPLALSLCYLGGLVLALTGWWLTGDRFDECARVAAVLVAGGALIAWSLRLARWLWATTAGQIVSLGTQAALGLTVVIVCAAPDAADRVIEALLVALAAPVLVVAANLGLRKLLSKVRRLEEDDLRGLSLPIAALLSIAAGWLVVWRVDGGDETRAVLTAAMTIAILVAIPILLDRLRGALPRGRPLVIGLVLLAIAGGGVALADQSWVPEALVAAVALLTAFVAGVLLGHLSFLGAPALVWRSSARSGHINDDEAAAALAWRDGGEKPRSARVRTVLQLVHPGSKNPRGLLQSKVSEIFDDDDPPFYKQFLRLDVKGGFLTVRCFGVTGNETKPGEVKVEHTVEIPLVG